MSLSDVVGAASKWVRRSPHSEEVQRTTRCGRMGRMSRWMSNEKRQPVTICNPVGKQDEATVLHRYSTVLMESLHFLPKIVWRLGCVHYHPTRSVRGEAKKKENPIKTRAIIYYNRTETFFFSKSYISKFLIFHLFFSIQQLPVDTFPIYRFWLRNNDPFSPLRERNKKAFHRLDYNDVNGGIMQMSGMRSVTPTKEFIFFFTKRARPWSYEEKKLSHDNNL